MKDAQIQSKQNKTSPSQTGIHQVSLLKKILRINSVTENSRGVNLVQKELALQLKLMGFEIELVKNEEVESGDLLIATYAGQTSRRICFVGHADTVIPYESEDQVYYDPFAQTLRGPGVLDDKAGLVTMLGAIEDYLGKTQNPSHTLTVVISPNEEVGSPGFQDLFRKLGDESDYVFGFEPALKGGDLICSRSGNRWYNIVVEGRGGHAGRFGEPCVNAAHELSLLVSELHQLNDEANKIRLNIGSISAGQGKFNIICNRAEAKLDVRFSCFNSSEETHEKIVRKLQTSRITCPNTNDKARLSFKIEDDCPPMTLQESNYICQEIQKNLLLEENRLANFSHSGGAADINYFSTSTNSCLDGLGGIGGKMHTLEEYVYLPSLATRARALADTLHTIDLNEGRHQDDSRNIN